MVAFILMNSFIAPRHVGAALSDSDRVDFCFSASLCIMSASTMTPSFAKSLSTRAPVAPGFTPLRSRPSRVRTNVVPHATEEKALFRLNHSP